jgi:hypothetical protein
MLKPHVTSKRVLGAVLAMGLVAAGSLAVASSSEAVTIPGMALTPASGATVGGDIIGIKGTGLADANGNSVVKSAYFSTAACADGTPTSATGYVLIGSGATIPLTVVSATKATLVIPTVSLTAGSFYICLSDSVVASSGSIVGSSKYTAGVKPVITTVNGVATATTTVLTASTLGGTALTFVGTDFTKKTVVSVGGTKAATKYVSATKVTAIVPAGTAGVGKAIKVASEYGSATSAGNTVTYLGVAKVTPIAGLASTAVGITLTGSGFNSLTFGAGALGKSAVAFLPAPTTLVVGTTVQPTLICTSINVESDTSLTCLTPASLIGSYSVQILTEDAGGKVGVVNTVTSRSGTFTAAAF